MKSRVVSSEKNFYGMRARDERKVKSVKKQLTVKKTPCEDDEEKVSVQFSQRIMSSTIRALKLCISEQLKLCYWKSIV